MADDNRKLTYETLSEDFREPADADIFMKIVSNRKLATSEMKRAREVSRLFVERSVAGVDEESLNFESRREAISVALMMVGMNDKGRVLVDDVHVEMTLNKFLPMATGESIDYNMFNTDVNRALLNHLDSPENSGFAESTFPHIDNFLNKDRVNLLLDRVAKDVLPTDLDKESLDGIAKRFDVPTVEYRKTGGKETVNMPPGSENLVPDQIKNAAKLGDHSTEPDWAELNAQEKKASMKYEMDVDLETDTLQRLNALMAASRDRGEDGQNWNNGGLVNRTVVNKLKDWTKDKTRALIDPDARVYPSESIFSETLSKVDVAGRVEREFVRFNSSPLSSFQAKMSDPNVPPEVYEIVGLRAKMAGIRKPYIKANFSSNDTAMRFMEGSIKGLLAAGYDISDIRVQESLRPYFDAYVKANMEYMTVGESPDDLAESPDDPGVREKHMDPIAKEQLEAQKAKLPEDIIAEQLEEINGPLKEMSDRMMDAENPMDIKDFSNDELIAVLAKAPLLRDGDSEYWNLATRKVGLTPNTREVVKNVHSYFAGLTKQAKASMEGSGKPLGSNQEARLVAAHETLKAIHPERAADFDRIINPIREKIDGVKAEVESAKQSQKNEAQNPSQPSVQDDKQPANNGSSAPENAQSKTPDSTQTAPSQAGPNSDEPPPGFMGENPPLPSSEHDTGMSTSEGEMPDFAQTGMYEDQPPEDYDMHFANAQMAGDGEALDPDGNPIQLDDGFSPVNQGVKPEGQQGSAPRGDSVDNDVRPEPEGNIPDIETPEEQTIQANNAPSTQDASPEDGRQPSEADLQQGDAPQEKAPEEQPSPKAKEKKSFEFVKEDWVDILNKDLEDLTADEIVRVEAVAKSPDNKAAVNRQVPDGNWSRDEIDQFKHIMTTVHNVAYHLVTDPSTFGVQEDALLKNMSDDMVPIGLQDYRAKLLEPPKNDVPDVEPEMDQPGEDQGWGRGPR